MIAEFRGEYYFLSNFYVIDVEVDGIVYPSSEHAYMSYKSIDLKWKLRCQDRTVKPSQIKKESYETITLVDNWTSIKLEVMEKCLRAKFSKDPMKTLLMETGNQNLQEGNNWHDRFYGIDITQQPNVGENHLGRLLMKIRDEMILKRKSISIF